MKETFSVHVQLIEVTPSAEQALNALRRVFGQCAQELFSCVMMKNETQFDSLTSATQAVTLTEQMVHKAAGREEVEYPWFDLAFPEMPSYLRRAAINKAWGCFSSFESRRHAWKVEHDQTSAEGKKMTRRAPGIGNVRHAAPAIYRGNMFSIDIDGEPEVELKLPHGRTWAWFRFRVSHQDWLYLRAASLSGEMGNPSVVKAYGHYELVFPFTAERNLTDTPLTTQKALGVDLGINTPAVCSVVAFDGTVEGRKFIARPGEKAAIDRILGKIKKVQQLSGTGVRPVKLYTKLRGLKTDYARQIAHQIVKYAISEDVDVIVMEYLSSFNGRRTEQVQHWAKRYIQTLICGMAHRAGIRYAFINPKNTSALAFDGSGKVTRDRDNYSLCTFTTGKRYNCDLNASYNIAARYFERELIKTVPETERWVLPAKVPADTRRTHCTLAEYRKVLAYALHDQKLFFQVQKRVPRKAVA